MQNRYHDKEDVMIFCKNLRRNEKQREKKHVEINDINRYYISLMITIPGHANKH